MVPVLDCGCGRLLELADDPPRVENAWNPSEDPQTDVDDCIGIATGFEAYGDWRNEDCKKIEEDVRAGRWWFSHDCVLGICLAYELS